jgi:hypothetical protein
MSRGIRDVWQLYTYNWFIVKGFVVRNLTRLQVLTHVEHSNQHLEYNYCSLLPISEHISSDTLTFNWLVGQTIKYRDKRRYIEYLNTGNKIFKFGRNFFHLCARATSTISIFFCFISQIFYYAIAKLGLPVYCGSLHTDVLGCA